METKFKIGQVWMLRDGRTVTISDITDDIYPIKSTDGWSFAADGFYYAPEGPRPYYMDMVELVTDVAAPADPVPVETEPEPEPAPEAPKFAVGQVWRRRDDRTIRIDEVEGPEYEGSLVVLGDDGIWRNRKGSVNGSEHEDAFDLVQLLPVTEPSAPAIADAMLADAVALAPQHDDEASHDAEPVPTLPVKLDLDSQAGTVRQLASEEERALFDALIIRAVDNSGINHTVNQLDDIRKIIAARRAL